MAGDGGAAGRGGNAGVGMSGQSGGSAGMSVGSSGAGGHSGAESSGGAGGGAGDHADGGMDAQVDGSSPMPDAAIDAGDDAEADSGASTPTEDAAMPDPNGPITGKVIDYYENPVADVIVRLNGESVVTDAAGAFEFAAAPPTYSLSLSLSYARLGVTEQAGYMFVDLTRRDPTLQVLRGNPLRSGDVTRLISGPTFPLPVDQEMPYDVGGPHGGFAGDVTGPGFESSGSWEGPPQAVARIHAIHYENSATAPRLPISYLAHDSESFVLDDFNDSMVALDMTSSGTLPTGIVAGDVSSTGGGARSNYVFVRFADDVAVQIVEHGGAPDSFTYLVPSIASSSIAVAAERGDTFVLPQAVAYVDGVAPGTTDIELQIPSPSTLEAPSANATNVDASTTFSWAGDDQVYMVRRARRRLLRVLLRDHLRQVGEATDRSGERARLSRQPRLLVERAHAPPLRDHRRCDRAGRLPRLVLLRPAARPAPRVGLTHLIGGARLQERVVDRTQLRGRLLDDTARDRARPHPELRP